jgi:hypothetical protein
MLENTVRWRREYRPDELDPDYIKPEVFQELLGNQIPGKSFILTCIYNRPKLVKCISMGLTSVAVLYGL